MLVRNFFSLNNRFIRYRKGNPGVVLLYLENHLFILSSYHPGSKHELNKKLSKKNNLPLRTKGYGVYFS
jgi:hypothetical protein